MYRKLLYVGMVTALAAGCGRNRENATAPAPAETPPAVTDTVPQTAPPESVPADAAALPPEEATAECDAEVAKQYIGQVYTPELGEEARVAAGARVARALRPGQIVTMEFLADRLSFTLDEGGRISAANCG